MNLFLLVFIIGAVWSENLDCVKLISSMKITQNTVICPGSYLIDDKNEEGILKVMASSVSLTLTNVTLSSQLYLGYGVVVVGMDNVKVIGGNISGFRSAVLVINGTGHEISNAMLSNNRMRKVFNTSDDFLDVWLDFPEQLQADQIGNGVVFVNVTFATIHDNTMTYQQNGVSLFGCEDITINYNDCSNNSGWGISISRSSHNLIFNNIANNCYPKVSTYCHQFQQVFKSFSLNNYLNRMDVIQLHSYF